MRQLQIIITLICRLVVLKVGEPKLCLSSDINL